MSYSSYKEDEAYRDGKRDAEYGRRDHYRDDHAWSGPDKAYNDGYKEVEREEERREEYGREERAQEEREERQNQCRIQRQQQEDEDYYMQMSEQEYADRMQKEQHQPAPPAPLDDLPF